MASTFAFVVGLLQAALALLGFVQAHPELPPASRDQAQQVAQQAITQATNALSTNSQPSLQVTSINNSQVTVRYVNLPQHSIIDVYDAAAEGRHPSQTYSSDPLPLSSGILTIPAKEFLNGESYRVVVRNVTDPNGPIAIADFTFTVSQSDQSAITVPGMSKYTDSDFGFAIWLPNTWTMTKQISANMLNSSEYQGGTLSAAWDFSGSVDGRIDEYYSPNRSISVAPAVGMGSNYYTLYFDTNTHTWIQTFNGQTTAADVSNNTMGGLHMISIPNGLGSFIVPLSAHNFLIIHSEGRDYLDGVIKTILATDPSVATPVDIGTQTQTVQAEYNNYVTAPAKCNDLGDVGGLTIQRCIQDAVRGQ